MIRSSLPRDIPRSTLGVLVLLVIFVILGVIYSAVIPLFEPPDEIWHFAFADHLAKGGGLPVFEASKSVFLREGGQPPLYYALTALVIAPFDRGDFPTWVRFNSSHPAITRGATSDTPNVFIHTAREDWPWTSSVLAVHVARIVSLVFGAVTIAGVYQAGRIVTGRDDLALAGAALIAFTPQFVFISASVNNDSLAAATSAWVGVAALQISNINYQLSKWGAIWVGVLLGLGLLAKLGGLILFPLVGLAFLIRWFRQRSLLKSEIWYLVFGIVGVAVLTSGWWFARNVMLYGDPLGWSVWLSDIGVRTPTPALWQLVPEFPALFRTYWADLPGYVLSEPLAWLFAALTLFALVGLIQTLVSALRSPTSDLRLWTSDLRPPTSVLTFDSLPPVLSGGWHLIFFLLWFGIVFAGVLRYMQTTPAAQGRLMFPALAPIGILLARGLSVWSRRPWLVGSIIVGLLVLTLVAPFAIVLPMFAKPVVTQLPADARPVQAQFGDHIELVGVRVGEQVKPGESLQLTTYWRTIQAIPRDQRLLIRLMRPDGNSAGQLDATLGTNLYPTTLWRPGQIVMDTHQVRADADLLASMVLRVQLGVGDEVEPLLPVSGVQAWSSGDVADVGEVQVAR